MSQHSGTSAQQNEPGDAAAAFSRRFSRRDLHACRASARLIRRLFSPAAARQIRAHT